MLRILSVLVLFAPALALAQQPQFHGKYPLKVVATVGMITDLVKEIGSEHVIVETLIGSGGDPHLYKASPKDVLQLARADLIFYNGLFLEGKMADILKKYSKEKPTYAVAELIDRNLLLQPQEFAGHYDPHLWMDVAIWSEVARSIAASLSAFDPANKTDYSNNFLRYSESLKSLHDEVKALISSIPKAQRVLVTAHDAFNYFGRAYDIEVRGIQGISTESEAGLKDINTLVDFLVERNIRAVFVESSVAQKNIMALVEGAKYRGHTVKIGGELFSDSMGASGTSEGTYIGMVRHNSRLIASGLRGTSE